MAELNDKEKRKLDVIKKVFIRYYGFYRKKHSIHSKMIPLIKSHCRNFRKQLLTYEASIYMAFHRNPYNCPKCDTKMNFVLSII